jgi:hypothetical protein
VTTSKGARLLRNAKVCAESDAPGSKPKITASADVRAVPISPAQGGLLAELGEGR